MAEITFKIEKSKEEIFARLYDQMQDLSNKQAYDFKKYKLFLMAAAVAYNWNQRLPLSGKATKDLGRVSYFKEEERFLVYAIYYDNKPVLDTPPNMAEAIRLVEEYANAGIDILGNLLDKEQEFRDLFIDLVLEVHEG